MYVVIAGPAVGKGHITSDVEREPNDYVANIVYGDPKITTVVVGRHFVALCEYAEGREVNGEYTHGRMGSFGYGSNIVHDEAEAHNIFGALVASFAPTLS